MDTTFYMNGVLYLRWKHNGFTYEAVKEQVDILGKEVFEQELDDYIEATDIPEPDGVTFAPMWKPTSEELAESIRFQYHWMRDMEIM